MTPQPIAIYLAGPMDGITDEEARGWRDAIDPPDNVVLFNPATCFVNDSKATAPAISNIYKHVIVCCDGVLVNLLGSGRAFGTIREIEFAKMHGKPVAVACGEGLEEHSIMTFDVDCYRTVDDAFLGLLSGILDSRNEPHPLGVLLQLPGFVPPQEPDDAS